MWFIYALSAGMLWGLAYAVDGQIYKHISVVTSLAIATLLTFVVTSVIAYYSGSLQEDLTTIASSKQTLRLVVFSAIIFLAAEVLIGVSISQKNATLAGLVEISYPFFAAAFSFLLFREQQMSVVVLAGGLLIFAGVSLVYIFGT
jgi:drug/metabolite transporter (DMT)-like permease